MTYIPESVPPLADDEIVAIVDDLAELHDEFDGDWATWQEARNAHEQDMIGRIALIKADESWPRSLNFRDTKLQRTRAEIELQIPPEYSEIYRLAGAAALRRTPTQPKKAGAK